MNITSTPEVLVTAPLHKAARPSLLHTVVTLFKLRVVMLLVFSSVAGAFLGAGGWPTGGQLALLLVTGTVVAAGASAMNQYIERESDGKMQRTRHRPLVSGAIAHPGWVPVLSLAMMLVPSLAVLPSHPALALFLLAGAVIYVGIYTLWLKPRTTLNIVIGGAAGSCAVLSGGAAVGAWADPGVIAVSLLVFFWTPIHFWALALVYREDYARAGVPMLPVRTAPRTAAFWGLLHGIAGGLIGLALVWHPAMGLPYAIAAVPVTAYLIWQGAALLAQPTGRRAWRLFHASNLYLAVMLLAVCLAALM